MQRQNIDAAGHTAKAPWIAYKWLQAKKNIRTQHDLENELRKFAASRQLNERVGISQSALSGILSGQRRMSDGFCEVMTLYLRDIRNEESFKFPDNVELLLNELRDSNDNIDQELVDQSHHLTNIEIPRIEKERKNLNHLNGAWHLYFYSRRDGDLSRKIRRALIVFCQDPNNQNPYAKMSVKSIGESTQWIGECEKIEKYWYVSLDRGDIFIERMFLILPCPDYWNDILVGMVTGIEGRKRNLVHPIISTKCIVMKCQEELNFEKLSDDDIDLIRKRYCGYVEEHEWIEKYMKEHEYFVERMNNEVSEDNIPFVLKLEPNGEQFMTIKPT